MSHTSDRINTLAGHNKGTRYLEIGVSTGSTFLDVKMPLKVAVDPAFRFSTLEHEKDGTHFYRMTSDAFFEKLPTLTELSPLADKDGKVAFDVIFIDGLHVYEQVVKDFENSLQYAHKDTIWIIDDTVPNDPFSLHRSQDLAVKYRRAAGGTNWSWHGDVFKFVFILHDQHKTFSYCTIMDKGNPQTVLWQTDTPRSDPSLNLTDAEISSLNYFSMLENSSIFLPVKDKMLLSLLGKTLNPSLYVEHEQWRRLIYSKMTTS